MRIFLAFGTPSLFGETAWHGYNLSQTRHRSLRFGRSRRNLPFPLRVFPVNQQDRITKLAKTDFAEAFKLAQTISGVRERIQSLGWVARYAPAAEVTRVIVAVRNAAEKSTDHYACMMALAWPLRALQETGHGKQIPTLLKTALQRSTMVQPAASQAEALKLLIHAVLPHDLRTVNPAVAALKAVASETHWRVVRALVDVAFLINAFDRQTATDIAKVIPIENKRNATMERISSGETMQVRPFFW